MQYVNFYHKKLRDDQLSTLFSSLKVKRCKNAGNRSIFSTLVELNKLTFLNDFL